MFQLVHPVAPTVGRLVRVAQVALLLTVAAFAVTAVPGVRSGAGFDPILDGWLNAAGYLLAALVAAARPATRVLNRRLWTLVAVSLTLRAIAFLLYLGLVRGGDPALPPSVADVVWLASRAVLLAALWQQLRVRIPRLSKLLVLDAVVTSLVAAAAVWTVVYRALPGLVGPGTPPAQVATHLVHPVLDVALIVMVLGGIALMGWRPTPTEMVVGVAVVTLAAADVFYLYRLATGSLAAGSVLRAVSLLATAVIALAAWLPRPRPPRAVPERLPGLAPPAAAALFGILILLYDTVAVVPFGSSVLVACGLGAAIVRALLTMTVHRSVARSEIAVKRLEMQRFRALVEGSGDFIAIAGMDDRMVYVNPAGRRIVGLPPDVEVADLSIADLLPEASHQHWLRVRRPAVLEHGHWEGESSLRAAGGGPPIPMAISSFLIRHPDTGDPWLVATVQVDISDRVAAEQAVRRLADQRQALLRHLVEAQEAERARIAADVHDDSVQALAAVELRLLLLHQQVSERVPDLVASVDTVRETVRGATDRLRHLLFDLESPAQRSDLATALEEAAAYIFEDSIAWTRDGTVDAPEETRVTAYRIAKEAMVNVRKHAGARRVEIGLRDEAGGVEVTIADDGRGIDAEEPADRPGHLGLANMRDRAMVAGGRVVLEDRPGGGTVVRLWLPIPRGSADPHGSH